VTSLFLKLTEKAIIHLSYLLNVVEIGRAIKHG